MRFYWPRCRLILQHNPHGKKKCINTHINIYTRLHIIDIYKYMYTYIQNGRCVAKSCRSPQINIPRDIYIYIYIHMYMDMYAYTYK